MVCLMAVEKVSYGISEEGENKESQRQAAGIAWRSARAGSPSRLRQEVHGGVLFIFNPVIIAQSAKVL